MAPVFSHFPALLLLLLLPIIMRFPQCAKAAELQLLPGYTPTALTLDLKQTFLYLIELQSSYASTVTKRLCVLSVESVSKAALTNTQLNYHVTGCDVRLWLYKLGVVATKTVMAEEIGACSPKVAEACKASSIQASFEVIENNPSPIWYIMYATS